MSERPLMFREVGLWADNASPDFTLEATVTLPTIDYDGMVLDDGEPEVVATADYVRPVLANGPYDESPSSTFEETLAQDNELFPLKEKYDPPLDVGGNKSWDEIYDDPNTLKVEGSEDRLLAAVKKDYGGEDPQAEVGQPDYIKIVQYTDANGKSIFNVVLYDANRNVLNAVDARTRARAEDFAKAWKDRYYIGNYDFGVEEMKSEGVMFTETSSVEDPYIPSEFESTDGVVNGNLRLVNTETGRIERTVKEEDDLGDEMWGQRLAMIPTDD